LFPALKNYVLGGFKLSVWDKGMVFPSWEFRGTFSMQHPPKKRALLMGKNNLRNKASFHRENAGTFGMEGP